ncbi:hypothetical protein KIPB_000458 [Kipferlia bialata]|uniref:N-acetyltransferase domain-containing protein n=1 Tax=Kipferlia bialata TaxID=797122 RepID=A0A9K3CP93_9EUKA|nr:hypothetical protein KIPB_000458 [Kipferlia bialata]|eukprot:g458.t1
MEDEEVVIGGRWKPRTRLERKADADRDLKEKSRLSRRREDYHSYQDPGDIQHAEEGTSGYISEESRFDRDFLAEERSRVREETEAKNLFLANRHVNGSTVEFRLGCHDDLESILSISNDAYKADEFFKLPEYHQRFTRQDVQGMMDGEGDYLCACAPGGGQIVGCLYLSRTVTVSGEGERERGVHCKGTFGCVAVGRQFDRRGIGSALIREAERLVLQSATEAGGASVTADIGMGVLNVRPDLFTWYGKQGYLRGQDIRPTSDEITRITLPGYDVCCVKMEKKLR